MLWHSFIFVLFIYSFTIKSKALSVNPRRHIPKTRSRFHQSLTRLSTHTNANERTSHSNIQHLWAVVFAYCQNISIRRFWTDVISMKTLLKKIRKFEGHLLEWHSLIAPIGYNRNRPLLAYLGWRAWIFFQIFLILSLFRSHNLRSHFGYKISIQTVIAAKPVNFPFINYSKK